jgi:hypothetical protein
MKDDGKVGVGALSVKKKVPFDRWIPVNKRIESQARF